MQRENACMVNRKQTESNANIVARIEFVVRAVLRDSVDTDFVHSILGTISAQPEEDGDEEEAGYLRASLVQFGAALDHGISAARLGDGISGDISEYWERLFDPETGYLKEEVQDEYEVVGLDLLIIDCVELYPKFRGLGIGASAVQRAIDVFGMGCGLIACTPWPLQFTPAVASDQETLKRLETPKVGKDEALRKLRSYWARLGFWPLGNTGIYVLSISQRGSDVRPRDRGTGLQ